ncbi:hypothetical protein [Kitasatospora acidiphila]|nr:hypothetical protein [Kitasatospora acidiphila]
MRSATGSGSREGGSPKALVRVEPLSAMWSVVSRTSRVSPGGAAG